MNASLAKHILQVHFWFSLALLGLGSSSLAWSAEPALEAEDPAILQPPAVITCPVISVPGPSPEHVVQLEISLSETGKVVESTILTGEAPYTTLAAEAMSECSFTPATENGEAIPVIFPFTWVFPEVLPEVPVAPNEVVATYRVESTAVSRILDAQLIRRLPGTLGDPVRALTNQPGVVRTPFDAGYLLLRGGGPDDTAVFVDGVRVPLLFHLGGLASILHSEMVDTIELTPGAFHPRYGNSLSGAANLKTKIPTGGPRLNTGINLAWAQAYAEVPAGPGTFAASARQSYLDAVIAGVLGGDRGKIASRFTDAAMRWDTPHGGVIVLGLLDSVTAPTDTADTTVTIGQGAVQIQGYGHFAAGPGEVQLRMWAAAQQRTYHTLSGDEAERQIHPGLRAEWTGKIGPARFDAGVDGELRRYYLLRDIAIANSYIEEPTTVELGRGTWIGTVGPYANLAAGKEFRGEAGIRLETLFAQNQLARIAASPRGAIHWSFAPSWAIGVEAGRLHQAPEPVFTVGLPEGEYKQFERSDFGVLSFRFAQPVVAVDLSGWIRSMAHLARSELDGTLGDQQGFAYGVESWLRLHLPTTEARVILQYSRSFQREEPTDFWQPTRYDQPLIAQIAILQELPKNWSLGVRWRYGSGFYKRTFRDTTWDILSQQERPLEVNRNGRLAPFHALDLKVAKRWTWRKAWLDLSLDLQNAYFRRVPEPVVGTAEGPMPVYGFGLPILPILGIEVGWEGGKVN